MTTEDVAREAIAHHGRSLFERGLVPGSSGNLSVRLADGLLVTPTNSCLGRLDPARVSRLDLEGKHVAGDPPSKEAFLHLAVYREREKAGAIAHLHSTHAVALSCFADTDPRDALPPLTPYSVMKLGRVPLVPYHRPGDRALAEAVGRLAREHHALLLANHGPVVAGGDLDAAVNGIEELEEAAKLALLLRGAKVRLLTDEQVRALREAFPS
jgi:ribulose-5-phosphate 4-epimerase/fuculose-1-phosphate aldolase